MLKKNKKLKKIKKKLLATGGGVYQCICILEDALLGISGSVGISEALLATGGGVYQGICILEEVLLGIGVWGKVVSRDVPAVVGISHHSQVADCHSSPDVPAMVGGGRH